MELTQTPVDVSSIGMGKSSYTDVEEHQYVWFAGRDWDDRLSMASILLTRNMNCGYCGSVDNLIFFVELFELESGGNVEEH
jgi:hypothetical protein